MGEAVGILKEQEKINHVHGENCDCTHDHENHEHTHHHEHGEGCGHDHGNHEHTHHHEHGESCGCGHDHAHQERPVDHRFDHVEKQVFLVENLDCANCAAKMERKVQELPQIDYAVLTFATKQLQVVANSNEDLLPEIQAACSSIESGVVVTRRAERHMQRRTEREETKAENRKSILEIVSGTALFVAGWISMEMWSENAGIVCFVLGYLILGHNVLLSALRNLTKGHAFDENFLMSIATLGAFAIREFPEAVGVMLFYRVGELFEDIAVEKSRSQIMEAVDLRPEVVNRIEGEEVLEIPAEEAMIGDLLLVRPGDRIPLDGRVEDGESRIDTSPVTGEPVPVTAKAGDSVLSGCVNTTGLLRIRVEKRLEESMVTKILDSVENAAASKPQIDRFITRFSRIYTPVVVFLALGTAILPSLYSGNWNYWIYTALTFLVISCPCALVLSVPLAFFSGIGAGSKKGILFKGGVAIEGLQSVKAVVMDKTGTVTEGNFVVQSIETSNKIDVTEQDLLLWAASCEMNSTHPIAGSILTAAKERDLKMQSPESMEELSGRGVKAMIQGKKLLCGNKKLLEENGVILEERQRETHGTIVFLAVDGVYAGCIHIADTVKSNSRSAIGALKRLHIVTAMLTGDAQESAQAVAKETGIEEVHARLLPEEKLKKLQEIRKRHGSVMFVGDGINDAPVLAGADVGAAMGSGADAAIEAADVVFMTSDMNAVVQSIRIAAVTGKIARENVTFAITIKILVMIFGLLGFANMWFAVFADTGVAMLCILNSIRILYKKNI